MRLTLPEETINESDIVLIKANRMYSEIILTTGRKVLVSKPLSWYDLDFLRPHKSVLVNPKHVFMFTGTHIKTKGDYVIRVSNRKLNEMREYFC